MRSYMYMYGVLIHIRFVDDSFIIPFSKDGPCTVRSGAARSRIGCAEGISRIIDGTPGNIISGSGSWRVARQEPREQENLKDAICAQALRCMHNMHDGGTQAQHITCIHMQQ